MLFQLLKLPEIPQKNPGPKAVNTTETILPQPGENLVKQKLLNAETKYNVLEKRPSGN